MAVIRPNKPISSGASPYLKKAAPKVAGQPAKQALPSGKLGDQVQISHSATSPALAEQKAESPASKLDASKSTASEVPKARAEAAPKVLTQEAPSTQESAASDQETTNWVLESVASTPYANDPSMEIVKRRFGTLSKEVSATFTEPLLDAITTDDQELGTKKLRDLASTANWAQKFKKDAAALAENGDFQGMLKRAKEAEGGGKKAKSLLDGVMQAKSLRFGSELPQNRVKEANQLLQQFQNGNHNPGIGSKALGKGISYLRGRKGTRIFYKQQGDETQWLAVCDKSTEPKAIKLLQKEFQLS